MSMLEPHDCSGDAAAYVLGALEPAEAELFRRHLDTCVVCRDEVAAFERFVDTLPAAVPQYRAPASLRSRVLHDAREQAKQQARAAAPAPHRLHFARGPVLAGAGAFAAVLIALVLALSGGGSSRPRTITAAVSGHGSATVRLNGGRAELILNNFPAPPAGEVYEVWLQHGNSMPSPTRTLFSVTSQGTADVGVTGKLSGVSRLLVTPERAGGSPRPTHPPVIVARVA
jgi:anti-sigma-K factor RskA